MFRVIGIAAAGMMLMACASAAGDAPPASLAQPPVAVASRLVCRLIADNTGAAAANITGADGAQSIDAGGRAYWFFGDTVRRGPGGRADVVPAAVAVSDDRDASDCIDLTFKAAGGEAAPLFPRGDETTAWPDGVIALDDGSIAFYMVKAYRQSPFAWHVGAVGLGTVRDGALTGERTVETIWDEQSGFGSRVTGARSPVRAGDDVYVYLNTEGGGNFVARAPAGPLGEAAAYRYWDGASWAADASRAAPMWPPERGMLPADNGVQVTRDERSGQWLALYNDGLARLAVRSAPEPWGPWSAPVIWLDCRALVEDRYPYCYSAEIHPELSRDGGATVYVTFSSQQPYDVSLVELKLQGGGP